MNILSARGNTLFMIFFAIAAFAALTFILSRQSAGTKDVSDERTRILASDVIDMGTSLKDAVARLRLRGISETQLSFENDTVSGYANGACTTDACKVFAFEGGGKSWETPAIEVNAGAEWGFAGNIAVTNIGGSGADLLAFLPSLPLETCRRINVLLGIHAASVTPPVIASLPAAKFTGSYAGSPTTIANATINGQRSACIQVTTASGTAISGTPLSNSYIYYQVLSPR